LGGAIIKNVLIQIIRKLPILNRIIEIRFRRRRASRFYKQKLKEARSWSWRKTELSNYYYGLTPRNRKDLAFLISLISGKSIDEIEGFFDEIENDTLVNTTLKKFKDSHPELRDSNMQVGRRIGWYALVRAMKPNLVIETGVHHGVGALVLSSAILRNQAFGVSGKYLGTDINPLAGELLPDCFDGVSEVIIGDSLETLRSLGDRRIDIFINDSDHSSSYELEEYEAILPRLQINSIILGDNSHATDSLRVFSEANVRRFLFFKEEPADHFYHGAGIGFSLPATLIE
jgi:predicted O-methyltransferase YrrM